MRGIYVHVPFCLRRCTYCDFLSRAVRAVPGDYAAMVAREAGLRAAEAREPADSLFFGGGTPSLLPSDQLALIVAAARKHLRLTDDAEITLEANPETVTQAAAASWAACGINRVSLGAQARDEGLLTMLGRGHTWDDVLRAASRLAATGISNLSLDLMYALPGQSLDEWRATLVAALDSGAKHLSCYALSLEPGTLLARRVGKGLPEPDADIAADQLECAADILPRAGYARYEISSYAYEKPSRHNLHYWGMDGWTALGCGAHGLDGRTRYLNHRDEGLWRAAMEKDAAPTEDVMIDDDASWRVSVMMMGLRRSSGITAEAFYERTGLDLWTTYRQGIDDAMGKGLLWKRPESIGPTGIGMNLQNRLLLALLGDDL